VVAVVVMLKELVVVVQEGEPEDTELQVLDQVHYREVRYF
jgi:hypothetical protein